MTYYGRRPAIINKYSSRFSRPYNVRLNGASASSNAMSSGSSPSRWLATKRLKERLTRSGMESFIRWYRTKARGERKSNHSRAL